MVAKEEKLKKGQKVTEKAVFLESALAGTKLLVGFLSGSSVLISDALHSVSDVSSILTSWFGLKIAQRKADERFPYGYFKAENLGTVVISGLIFYAAWQMLVQGYQRLFSFSVVRMPLLALGISFLDALILFFFGNYEIKIGKQTNVQSLIVMGKENRTHLFSSMAVFVGILAAIYKVPYLEGLIVLAIAFLILKIGLNAAKDSVFALMDVSPGKEIEEKVVKAIESVPGIEGFFDLRLRKSGPFYFGETKVGIRKFIDVKRAHEVADRIEKEIKRKVPQVESFSINIEPFKSDFHHLVIPVKDKKGLESKIAKRFARAPYFLFVNLKAGQIKSYYFLSNPHQEQKVRAGLAAAKLIAGQKSDVLIIQEIGEITFYTLRECLSHCFQVRKGNVKEIIADFVKDKLKPLKKATREK